MNIQSPVFCAIDTPDMAKAEQMAMALKGHVRGLKIGLEFFLAHGLEGYKKLAAHGTPLFLDLKLHDIPNTVKGAVLSLVPLQPDFITIHTGGGAEMMRQAAAAAATSTGKRMKVLGVTVLTSLDENDLSAVGQDKDVKAQVKRLALLAKESGLDGVVCSPAEVEMLREVVGEEFILMVPGIRPVWTAAQDQKRIMTPREAMDAGATHLVIGRPITGADAPVAAADRVNDEIFSAL